MDFQQLFKSKGLYVITDWIVVLINEKVGFHNFEVWDTDSHFHRNPNIDEA